MASVTLRNLNKVFTDQQTKKEVHAVKDMNLEIRDGEFLVLEQILDGFVGGSDGGHC